MIVTILCGLPGSTKSTFASTELYTEVINQDNLGSRKACLKRMEEALKYGRDVIIDRTNINKQQRKYFIYLAKQYNAQIDCIIFKSDPEECIKRIQARKNHPTIKEDFSLDKIREIVLKFVNSYEEPINDEGFTTIFTHHIDNMLGQK